MGWGFSSLVSHEGLLLLPGHATFIKAFRHALPSDRKVLLDFPMSASFDQLGLSSKVTSSESVPLTTLTLAAFLSFFHCL